MATTPKDYCTIEDVKANLKITGTQDDQAIQVAVSAASRLIDHECQRYFYQDDEQDTRQFIAEDLLTCEVDDFDPTQTIVLQTDPAGTRTWDQTWSTLDYQLEPLNGIYYGMAWPATKIRAIRSLFFPLWGGATIAVRNTQALVQLTATFGWPQVPDAVFQAAVIQASAISQASKNPIGASAFGESGIVRVKNTLHPTAQLLLDPYRKETVYVL